MLIEFEKINNSPSTANHEWLCPIFSNDSPKYNIRENSHQVQTHDDYVHEFHKKLIQLGWKTLSNLLVFPLFFYKRQNFAMSNVNINQNTEWIIWTASIRIDSLVCSRSNQIIVMICLSAYLCDWTKWFISSFQKLRLVYNAKFTLLFHHGQHFLTSRLRCIFLICSSFFSENATLLTVRKLCSLSNRQPACLFAWLSISIWNFYQTIFLSLSI